MARLLILFTWLGLAVSTVGCRARDEIRHYTVPKQSEIDRLAGGSGESNHTPQTTEPQRMLAAVVLRPSQGWFFKLQGPEEAVDLRADEFTTFLKSVHFQDDSTPEWSLPAGWAQQPGDQMRYATLAIGSTGLVVTVTSLSRGELEETEYVLNNVNRWRGQLGLDSIAPNELPRETKQVELADGTATLVDIVGLAKANAMTPPFASGGGSGALPPASSNAGAPGLKYDVPEGWQEEPATGFRKASFRLSEGGENAEASVSDLAASAGDLLPNVNRWRGQIGLDPTTQHDVDQHVEPIDVGSRQGQYIEMIGDDKATLAVIVKAAGSAWFIKLTGEKNLVERQRDNFKIFVHSLSISETAGANDGN